MHQTTQKSVDVPDSSPALDPGCMYPDKDNRTAAGSLTGGSGENMAGAGPPMADRRAEISWGVRWLSSLDDEKDLGGE